MRPFLMRVKESFYSVLPVTLIVVALNFILIPLKGWDFLGFGVGSALLVIGIAFFSLGADMSMMTVGHSTGRFLTEKKKISLIIILPLIIGALVTIAEPDLWALANSDYKMIAVVAVGVGIFLALAILRVVLKIDIRIILGVSYAVLFLLAMFVVPLAVPFAFDSGGATTGPMTVPFIMAIGVGVATIGRGSGNEDSSFGFVALCSVGPVLAVALLSLIKGSSILPSIPAPPAEINSFSDLLSNFGSQALVALMDVGLSLVPILAFVLIFELLVFKDSRRNFVRIIVGLLYVFLGLVIFTIGATAGFSPVGSFIGKTIAQSESKWQLIPIGMIMGFFVVMAEPAVHVLNDQVEEITGGAISKSTMVLSLAFGVAFSIGLAMTRVLFDFSIWWILVPSYVLAFVLMFFSPKVFTSIAFDSGGVASGPMTTYFLLKISMGACYVLYSTESGVDSAKMYLNGYGLVAFVAMTPLIVLQILGVIYKVKTSGRIVKVPKHAHKVVPVVEFEVDGIPEEYYA